MGVSRVLLLTEEYFWIPWVAYALALLVYGGAAQFLMGLGDDPKVLHPALQGVSFSRSAPKVIEALKQAPDRLLVDYTTREETRPDLFALLTPYRWSSKFAV